MNVRQDGSGVTLRNALGTSALWALALTWTLTQMALGAVYLHQVPLLTDQGLSTEAVSYTHLTLPTTPYV